MQRNYCQDHLFDSTELGQWVGVGEWLGWGTHTHTHQHTDNKKKFPNSTNNDPMMIIVEIFIFFYSFILVHFFFLCSCVSVYNGPNNLNWHLHTHTHAHTIVYAATSSGIMYCHWILRFYILFSHSFWPMAIAYRIKWKNRKEFHFFFSLSVCVCVYGILFVLGDSITTTTTKRNWWKKKKFLECRKIIIFRRKFSFTKFCLMKNWKKKIFFSGFWYNFKLKIFFCHHCRHVCRRPQIGQIWPIDLFIDHYISVAI